VARLHSRIYLHFLGVLLVVAFTTAVVFGLGERDAFRREMALGLARHVAALLGERATDREALAARVRQIHEDLRLNVRVRDLDGRVLAAAGEALPALPPASDAEVRTGADVLWMRPMGFAAAIRHPASGAVVGVVEAAAPRPLGMPPIWRPVLWAALALAMVAVATRPLAQRISRPVERLALELLPRDATAAQRLSDVERDLAELDRLIEDVLTAARLDATGLPAHLGVIDANTILEDVAERAHHDPLTAGVALHVEEGTGVQVTADGALLRRALWNLVENAAKYGAPPITLSAARDGDRVTLTVADEGPGIVPAERERVVAPFYRGEARPAGTPGVGLGLTLARRIAEVHGGTASIESGAAPQRGCRLVISIPARITP
jgi:signal transduction histidine kinase